MTSMKNPSWPKVFAFVGVAVIGLVLAAYSASVGTAGVAASLLGKRQDGLDLLSVGSAVILVGVAGTAILVRTLHSLGAQDVRTYIPNRYEEGYGLNDAAIRSLAAEGARVIVSVDCGVTAVREARVARELGVDLIVTDHHHPPRTLPEPYALVNPRRKGDPYPDKELAGAGVAFLLATTLARERFDAVRDDCLQLAAVATVADVVPLRGANRWLVREGLALLNRAPLAGFRAIAKRSGLRLGGIEAYHIGFVIGPRLNAAGRLADAIEAL